MQDHGKQVFVTGGNDCKLRIWSLLTYDLEAQLCGHTGAITCLAIDANFLFSGSEDNTIRIWNCSSFQDSYCLSTLAAHTESVRDILILPDLGHLVSCAGDGLIRVWDYSATSDTDPDQSGRILKEYKHNGVCVCVCSSHNKHKLRLDSCIDFFFLLSSILHTCYFCQMSFGVSPTGLRTTKLSRERKTHKSSCFLYRPIG